MKRVEIVTQGAYDMRKDMRQRYAAASVFPNGILSSFAPFTPGPRHHSSASSYRGAAKERIDLLSSMRNRGLRDRRSSVAHFALKQGLQLKQYPIVSVKGIRASQPFQGEYALKGESPLHVRHRMPPLWPENRAA